VLVERGAKVVLADLRQDHIDDALAEFAGGGRSNVVSALQLDVTNRTAYHEAARKMQDEFGGIDILVNNAGVGLEGPLLEATYADYDFGFGVNVGGVINGFTEFLPQMIAHGRGGHVVSTASLAAEVVMPAQMAIYAASKAAVCHFCESVKGELAEHGIGVSILLPGPVKSRIHETQQNRPAHLLEGSGFKASEAKLSRRIVGDNWMEAEDAGRLVADGILNNTTYIVTHGFYKDAMRARAEAVLAATPDIKEEAPDFGQFRDE
jgi:NAD(P)-dependent dehydrogenase (short-subunit alcohol dehydrogenase family)